MTKPIVTDPDIVSKILAAADGIGYATASKTAYGAVSRAAKECGIKCQRAWAIVRRERRKEARRKSHRADQFQPHRHTQVDRGRSEPLDVTWAEREYAYGAELTLDQVLMGTPPRGRSALDQKMGSR